MNLNRVEIAGGLTRDPEAKFLPSGAAVWEATVALNGTRYDSEKRSQIVTTTFCTVQAWGWLAEQATEAGLSRGDEIYVLGEFDQQEYEDRDGKKQRKTRIKAAIITPLRRRTPQATHARPSGPHTGAPPADQGGSGWGTPPQEPPEDPWGPGGRGYVDEPPF